MKKYLSCLECGDKFQIKNLIKIKNHYKIINKNEIKSFINIDKDEEWCLYPLGEFWLCSGCFEYGEWMCCNLCNEVYDALNESLSDYFCLCETCDQKVKKGMIEKYEASSMIGILKKLKESRKDLNDFETFCELWIQKNKDKMKKKTLELSKDDKTAAFRLLQSSGLLDKLIKDYLSNRKECFILYQYEKKTILLEFPIEHHPFLNNYILNKVNEN